MLQVWTDQQNDVSITVGNQTVEDVQSFTYLGSVVAGNGGTEADVKMRIGKEIAVFRRMRKIWNNAKIDQKIKLRLYITIVLPTELYASETWKVTAAISKKLNVFHQRYLRKIL